MAGVGAADPRRRRVRVAGEARGACGAARGLRRRSSTANAARRSRRRSSKRRCGIPDWCPIQPQDCWTELPDVIWPPLQRRLIDAMPGERIAPTALELPGRAPSRADLQRARVDRPRAGRLSAARVPDGARHRRARERRNRQSPSSTPAAPKPKSKKSSAASSRPAGRWTTSRSSARRRGTRRSIWEKAMRYDWPVTLGARHSGGD